MQTINYRNLKDIQDKLDVLQDTIVEYQSSTNNELDMLKKTFNGKKLTKEMLVKLLPSIEDIEPMLFLTYKMVGNIQALKFYIELREKQHDDMLFQVLILGDLMDKRNKLVAMDERYQGIHDEVMSKVREDSGEARMKILDGRFTLLEYAMESEFNKGYLDGICYALGMIEDISYT